MTTKGDIMLASRLARLKAPRAKTKYERELAETRRNDKKRALDHLYEVASCSLDRPLTFQSTFEIVREEQEE